MQGQGFIPDKEKPTKDAESFIKDQLFNLRQSEEADLYKSTKLQSGPKRIYEVYSYIFGRFYREQTKTITANVTEILEGTKAPKTAASVASTICRFLTRVGLLDIERPNGFKGPASISLGINAQALQLGEEPHLFSYNEAKTHMQAFRTYKKRQRLRNVEAEPEMESVSYQPVKISGNINDLIRVSERINADFKELEKRLERRKPLNLPQYYHDSRLLGNLKGEFATLMTLVLPQSEMEDNQNPGEFDSTLQKLEEV